MSNPAQVYTQGANLTLPNVNYNLYVIDLTTSKFVAETGMSRAIQALNDQVKNDFSPHWGAKGTLIDKTAEFHLHLTSTQQKSIISANPFDVSAALVDYIVAQNASKAIDWSKSGIIYLTDYKSQGFGGVHVDEHVHLNPKVADLDIPFALVTVSDSKWTSTLSHEVLELLADPWGMRYMKQSQYPIAKWASQNWIIEVCDACEDISYAAPNGVLVSDFVLPKYFTVATPVTQPLDFCSKLFRNTQLQPTPLFPYPMLKNGYLSFVNPSTHQFSQITWFNGTKPIYTAPQSDPSISHKKEGEVLYNCTGRLDKYIRHHKIEHPNLASRLARMGIQAAKKLP